MAVNVNGLSRWETEVFEGRFHLPKSAPPAFGEWADQFLLKVGHLDTRKRYPIISAAKPSLWIIGGQKFDDAEPVLLILPVGLEIVFVLRSQDRRSPCSTVLVQTRDKQSVGSFVFPTAIYWALRCDR